MPETKPTSDTKAADKAAAAAPHEAPQTPTAEESAAADRSRDSVDDTVRADYKDMTERGANQKGEGRLP